MSQKEPEMTRVVVSRRMGLRERKVEGRLLEVLIKWQ
jgi:hypothetical protein